MTGKENGPNSALAERADALMKQWVFERTDDQAAFGRMGAAAAGCITYATAVALAISSRVPICQSGEASAGSHVCHTLPPSVLMIAPLPMWFLFCSILIAIKGVQRRQPTIELLELEIGQLNRRHAPWPQHPSTRTDSARAFYDLTLTRGVQIVMYGGALLVTVGATVGALLLLFYVDDSLPLRAASVAVDSIILAVVVPFAVRRPRNPHSEILSSLREEATLAPPRTTERSLASYLVMPRPRYGAKWLFFPVCFGLAAWSLGGVSGRTASDAVLLWIALEYLIYPARYQWNDVRGFVDDAKHPDRRGRRRLPHGSSARDSRRIILISLSVAAIRVLVTAVIGIARPELLVPIAALVVTVFSAAIAYEALKEQRSVVALWAFVGSGYSIRGVAGLLAGGLSWGAPATIYGAATLWAFGISVVTMTWVLEAVRCCREDPPTASCKSTLLEKPHLNRLLDFVGYDSTTACWQSTDTEGPYIDASVGTGRALRGRGGLLAPWNVAFVIACFFGGITGAALADPAGRPSARLLLGFLQAAVASLVVWAPSNRLRSTLFLLGISVVGATALALGVGKPVLMIMPFAIVVAVFVWFRAQSYESLMGTMTHMAGGIALSARRSLSLALGSKTSNAIEFNGQGKAARSPLSGEFDD